MNVDDRIVLTDIPDLIESAIHAWHIFAMKRKLIENTGKLQKVACAEPRPEGFGGSMEVLGACVGVGGPIGAQLDAKQTKRLNKSCELINRLGILLENKLLNIMDFGVFVMCVCVWLDLCRSACSTEERIAQGIASSHRSSSLWSSSTQETSAIHKPWFGRNGPCPAGQTTC